MATLTVLFLLIYIYVNLNTVTANQFMESRAVDTHVEFKIFEEQPVGTTVGQIPVKTNFTYRFNEAPNEFAIDPKTGIITTKIQIDRESIHFNDYFDLVVLSSQPTYPIEVRIIILDINDNVPQFPESLIQVSFSENVQIGTRQILDTATDFDSAANSISDKYNIISGNHLNIFQLVTTMSPNGDSFYLHLEVQGVLDRETQSSYLLNISAKDNGNPAKIGYMQVNVTILDVNDNTPSFDQSHYNVSIMESIQIGTVVLKVTATDNDIGNNAKIVYYLSSLEKQFDIDPDNGIISTSVSKLNCPKRESCNTKKNCPKSCILSVFAKDLGEPSQDSRTFLTINLIDANDHDPVIEFRFLPLSAKFATVDENSSNGSVVAIISVNDADQGLNGETEVRIVAGNDLNHFKLEHSKSFDVVRINKALDREEISMYNLTVEATDKGMPARKSVSFLIIYVNDVNDHEPVFTKSEYSATLLESVPRGSYVASLTALDEDTGVNAEIYYAIVSGNENRWFSIDSKSGLVVTESELDREKKGVVELKVQARDNGPNPKYTYTHLHVTILDVNDEKPQFSNSILNISLSENTPIHTLITILSATDKDQGTNGSIVYKFHPKVSIEFESMFFLDSLNGQLTLTNTFDYEKCNFYEIRVIAEDQGEPRQSSTATILLNIIDINDNVPYFNSNWKFVIIDDNNLKIGDHITKIEAVDLDKNRNSLISYNFESSKHNELFEIDKWSGMIILKENLIRESKYYFQLTISANDQSNKKSLEPMQLVLLKKSKYSPIIFKDNYNFKINENIVIDSEQSRVIIGRIQAHNHLNHLKYYLIDGDKSKLFRIDETSGQLETLPSRIIDREVNEFFTLSIAAWNHQGFYGETKVNITVNDINDNAPKFLLNYSDSLVINVPEDTAVGKPVFSVKAFDLDFGENSTISFSLLNNNDLFKVNQNSGVLYLKKPINIVPNTQFLQKIVAKDHGQPSLETVIEYVIVISDVNDHTPSFNGTRKEFEVSISESISVNERFFELKVSDNDFGDNSLLNFEIINDDDSDFGVFPDGFLYVKRMLDREKIDFYSLIIKVRDNGYPTPRSSQANVIINVLDENDNKPKFLNETYIFTVYENEPMSTLIGQISAIDNDKGRNSELFYYIAEDDNFRTSLFHIDLKSGFVRTNKVFDREQLLHEIGQNFINFEARVSDNGHLRLQDSCKITVYILDVNDNKPIFLRVPYRSQISENSKIGTNVLKIYSSDADEGLNSDVFYKIIDGNDRLDFEIDESTGQISLRKKLDRELVDFYKLIVMAYDVSTITSLSSTVDVIIEVLDENDNAPVLLMNQTEIHVKEDLAVGTDLTIFKAIDSDIGNNGRVEFLLKSGNRRDSFLLDTVTGVLRLKRSLDFEDVQSFQLSVQAVDCGKSRLTSSAIFVINVIDVNDNKPTFSNTAIVRRISEGSTIGAPIMTVLAEDTDSGVNGLVTYSLKSQEPYDGGKQYFRIDKKTGIIYRIAEIDRESIESFRLTILASDSAINETERLTAEKVVTIMVDDVNDNSPIFITIPTLVRDGSRVRDLIQIKATDSDAYTNGLVTYDLITGDDDNVFRLNRNDGVLKLIKNVQHSAKYQLSIRATDEAAQNERKFTEMNLLVFLLKDLKSGSNLIQFAKGSYSVKVYENEPVNTEVITMTLNSFDSSLVDKVEFYLTNISDSSNSQMCGPVFDIDRKSGVVLTTWSLDRENGPETYLLEIYAIGYLKMNYPNNLTTAKTMVRVDILDKNDSPPVFKKESLNIHVSEDAAVGQEVAVIKAFDPDKVSVISYQLINDTLGLFEIQADNGALILKRNLDRELLAVYDVQVRANDGVQFTDAIVNIQILDSNDNAPVFSKQIYSFEMREDANRGTIIGKIQVTDSDQNSNAVLTYKILSDWNHDVLDLNSETGIFTLKAKLDYEEVQHYIFVIQAQDNGVPVLSSTATLYLNVIDLNDNAPLFDTVTYTVDLFENASLNSEVLTVSASDFDSDENGQIKYAITSGNENNDFAIFDNGTIIVAKHLDRENISSYNLIITATDQPTNFNERLSSTAQVVIILKDINDMSPEFVTDSELLIAENIAINTLIAVVKAVDRDEGRNGYVEYSFDNNEKISEVFSLGAIDGQLRVVGLIDRETCDNYTFTVIAKDKGEPARVTFFDMIVRVTDENDNNPVFSPKFYSVTIAENISIGTHFIQVFATDNDIGLNGMIRFSIVDGDWNHDFNMDESTGLISVDKNIDYERISRYTLSIRAEDCALINDQNKSQTVVRFDTATVTILISDINDNGPEFINSPFIVSVMENTIPANAGYLKTIQAFDNDSNLINRFIHFLIMSNGSVLFRINSTSGDLFLLKPLDREIQAEYDLTVIAMDSGSPQLMGTGQIKIVVLDENDESPIFEQISYSVDVFENNEIGETVIKVTATDKDEGNNGKVTYKLIGENSDRFSIDEDTGVIRALIRFDREEISTYHLQILAVDNSEFDQKIGTALLQVSILDKNDNKPIFINENAKVFVPNTIFGDELVYVNTALDSDSGNNSIISYQLIENQFSHLFNIDHESGVIRTKSNLESIFREFKNLRLVIEAYDHPIAEDEILRNRYELTIFPKNRSEFPVFSSLLNSYFQISEDYPKQKLLTKISIVGTSSVEYSILGGRASKSFTIDKFSGEIYFVDNSQFDYELLSSTELFVAARKSKVFDLMSIFEIKLDLIDVNDNAPTFSKSVYIAEIFEEQNGLQNVIQVYAEDFDQGENGRVSYSLIEDNDETFKINEKTGQIFTTVKLDREDIDSYDLVVKAIDHGLSVSLTSTTLVHIIVLDVNDNSPYFTQLFNVNVTENVDFGTFVVQLTSNDRDIGPNANKVFNFLQNPGEKFVIDPLSGNISVYDELDRELQDEYVLSVRVFDGAWASSTAVTISIQDLNDNAPKFEKDRYVFNVVESEPSNILVGRLTAFDNDKSGCNSQIVYQLKGSSDVFAIDRHTGEIYTKKSLNYLKSKRKNSMENQYLFKVVASDNGKPPLKTECDVVVNVVNVNKFAPKFEKDKYLIGLLNSTQQGDEVLSVKAFDEFDDGINAEVYYEIVDGSFSNYFSIDKTTGVVQLTNNDVLRNKRIGEQFSFAIEARDYGIPSKLSTCDVTVAVVGKNYYAPVFTAVSYQVIIPENEPIGTIILTVNATDEDSSGTPNGIVRYSIKSGNNNDEFKLNSITGVITINKFLDYEYKHEYYLNITAYDLGIQPKTASASVKIALKDINDNAPKFDQNYYEILMRENLLPNTEVAIITAEDIDSGMNSVIEYFISHGNDDNYVSIDKETGVLKSNRSVDYEQVEGLNMEVIALNPSSTKMISKVPLIIKIYGVNEYYPQFVQKVFHFEISESAPIDMRVGQVQAFDRDSGKDGIVYYFFVENKFDNLFKIDKFTGIITVAKNLDRETKNRAIFTVLAKNSGSILGNDADEAQVIISIEDGNDPPEFKESFYEVFVNEDIAIDTVILTVAATDKDVRPQNNQFSYSIFESNTSKDVFKIDAESGVIETVSFLDRELVAVHYLKIAAIDSGEPPKTGTTIVKIVLNDINDNPPILDVNKKVGQVYENEPIGTKIMQLKAIDYDLVPNTTPFSYRLVENYKDSDYVTIDKNSGFVKTRKIIDREHTSRLEVLVEIFDNGVPKLSSKNQLIIDVLDQNDNPSVSRNVKIVLKYFASYYQQNMLVANVKPNDNDLSGDYNCRLVDNNVINFMKLPSGTCDLILDLKSFDFKIDKKKFEFKVGGNDGVHNNVVSKVILEVEKFDDKIVNNLVVIKVHNCTASEFLTNIYSKLQDDRQIEIVSIIEKDSHLLLNVIGKNNDNTIQSKDAILKHLKNLQSYLNELFNNFLLDINYSICSSKTVCENDGICNDLIDVDNQQLSIIDTPSMIFSSFKIGYNYHCICPDGFLGDQCEKKQDPCYPNPCKSNGQCVKGSDNSLVLFQCLCPPNREGKLCQYEKQVFCSKQQNWCENGGTCQESPDSKLGYFCLCRPGYRGTRCELVTDSCRPNPCLNNGNCVSSIKPSYNCSCVDGFFGRHCEKFNYGFGELSFMEYPTLDATVNDISVIFSTSKTNSLLLYNYGRLNGGRSDFFVLEIINGMVTFSFGGSRTAICSISLMKFTNLSDGNWYKVNAIRNGRLVSLSASKCSEFGDVCDECKPNDDTCYVNDIGPTGTLNFDDNPLLIGGINNEDALLERPEQVHSDDFVGCIHSISLNGRVLNLNKPPKQSNVHQKCKKCLLTSLCHKSDSMHSSIYINEGSFVEFNLSKKHRRMQLFSNFYSNSNLGQKISLSFRTVQENGVLFYAASANKFFTSIELIHGKLVYFSKLDTNLINMTDPQFYLIDGQWHNITLVSKNRDFIMWIDNRRFGETLDTAGVHDFLDPYLTYLSIGGVQKSMYFSKKDYLHNFNGCLSNFSINDEVQSFFGSGSVFNKTTLVGNIQKGCYQLSEVQATISTTDPLNIGILLIVIFFVILFMAILGSFLMFRFKNVNKDANDIDIVTNHATVQKTVSSSTNADLMMNRGVHHYIGSEMVQKKFKDRGDIQVTSNEIQKPQRPDIIDREILNKNYLIREELHLPTLSTMSHQNDAPHSTTDINSEIPEHYDLENASSIAPSDIDIVYHYKGYRESNDLKKYCSSTPTSANNNQNGYNKHITPNHRHQTSRLSNNTSRNHQITPLARLSPSSELSSQQPRILTLHDISGKLLPNGLLSSKNNTNKGHNNDRTLNMSPLSINNNTTGSGPGSSLKLSPTNGTTTTPVNHVHERTSSLVSTLDAVSSSSDHEGHNKSSHLTNRHIIRPRPHHHHHHQMPIKNPTDDESGNESFTYSEIEFDETNCDEKSRNRTSFNGSMSTLVASDDDGEHLYDQAIVPEKNNDRNSPSIATLGWEYLLNWGQNYPTGLKDISEFSERRNPRLNATGNNGNNNLKSTSEEYV